MKSIAVLVLISTLTLTTAYGVPQSLRRTQRISDMRAQESAPSPAIPPGFEGDALGMEGQGFQAGFIKPNNVDFDSLAFKHPYNIAEKRCPTGMWRVGCIFDSQTHERRWYHEAVKKEDRVPMTPEVCFKFCSNISGTQFFGLMNGDRCYCTPFFHDTGKLGHTGCEMPCVGNSGVMCGGQEKADIYEMHDCSNLPILPCKKSPLPVQNAKLFQSKYYRKTGTPCQNAQQGSLTTVNSHCSVECEDGFALVKNTIACVEQGERLTYSWAQVVGLAVCEPVTCGVPKTILHASFSHKTVTYQGIVIYHCQVGYSINGLSTGAKESKSMCLQTGTFTEPSPCSSIQCGSCPVVSNASTKSSGMMKYQDECKYVCDNGFTLDGQAQGLAFFKATCHANGVFSELPKCMPVSCGTPENLPFTTNSAHGTEVFYPSKVNYNCVSGYTLTGVAGGSAEFSRSCLSVGLLSASQKCLPVTCGAPPQIKHATSSGESLVFNQTVTYTCLEGYSFDGKFGGETTTTIRCGADGSLESPVPTCSPVQCGSVPLLQGAKVVATAPSMINYDSIPIAYECNSGWSTKLNDDPYGRKFKDFSISCLSNGSFSSAPACVNVDDCLWHPCGAHGSCEDIAPPSGVPFDDYTCKCQPGYEITLHDSSVRVEKEKICTNINDCPTVETCGGVNSFGKKRGTCVDKVLGYECLCSSGYVQVTKDGNQTCEPVVCGPAPVVNNATHSLKGDANYDTPGWNYSCESGFSLDAKASGLKTFPSRCTTTGAFTPMQKCLPVTCGDVQPVRFADRQPPLSELFYPQVVMYNCEEGYSLDSQSTGKKSFAVVCKDDGTQTPLQQCSPVECGTCPPHKYASYDKSKIYVYQESADITCDAGYSLDQTTNPKSFAYQLPCLGNGSFDTTQKCKPVSCGMASKVNHTTKDESEKFYLETVTYSLDMGYTLDGEPGGPTEFSVKCKSTGTFSRTQMPKPVKCGLAPQRRFTANPGTSHVFKENATYTCLTGYSVGGKTTDPTTFKLTCTASGKYEGTDQCQPVSCGAITVPQTSEQVPDSLDQTLTSLVFGQAAALKCKMGFSMDGLWESTQLTSSITCAANGTLLYPSECINVDDCASPQNNCDKNGKCVDHTEPTGQHMKDFSCKCDSGFAENVTEKSKYCYNIDDCPNGACLPGSCSDLINNYKCLCPSGYYEDANPEKNFRHDCLPKKCGMPPKVKHASTLIEKDVFFNSPPVSYMCDVGYSLDGAAEGDKDFNISCLANATFQVAPICFPVVCGEPAAVLHASHAAGQVLEYTEKVTYTCDQGYSVTGVYGGDIKFDTECLANGSLTEVPSCNPVVCPPVPSQPNTSMDYEGHLTRFPTNISIACATGFSLIPDRHEDTKYIVRCTDKGQLEYSTPLRCGPISCGLFPDVVSASISGGHLFGQSAVVKCDLGHSVDGTTIPSSKLQLLVCQSTGKFTSVTNCIPIKCGVPPRVNHTTASATNPQVYLDEVTYTLSEGYTLDGTANGKKSFKIACTENGTFTATDEPLPVSCGRAPARPNATHPNRSHVYMQTEPYMCKGGHTLDGSATGERTYNTTCTKDGTYSGDKVCRPVQCGTVLAPPYSDQVANKKWGLLSSVVFSQVVSFECKPGYSLNGRLTGLTNFTQRCLANGSITAHPGCQNMNDCEGHLCSPNGKCKDLENPTGDHFKDYKCICDSGFKENITKAGQRTCSNVPDCPKGACLPGKCKDLVNDYKCECPAGYFEGPNLIEDLAHDCMPVSCGVPPSVKYASTELAGQDIKFATPPVEYTCDEGYSLDSVAGGDVTFNLECLANKSFSAAPKCLPVSCGVAPPVDFSKQAQPEKFWVFPESVPYSCDVGYTTTGMADGSPAFQASCEADGSFTGVLTCDPVKCPSPCKTENGVVVCAKDAFGPNAVFDQVAAANMVFPQSVKVTCLPGFSLNKDKHDDVNYAIQCDSSGLIKIPGLESVCAPIDCGPAPKVAHGKVTGSTRFGETLVATADVGWSLDGTVVNNEFTFTCMANGQFSELKIFQRVICGFPPLVDSATPEGGAVGQKVFEDSIVYHLDMGYSTNGAADGPKQFSIVCQGNASFSPAKTPLPINCGLAPPMENSTTSIGVEYTWSEKAPYKCTNGFTTDGVSTGQKTFNHVCTENGTFTGLAGCAPVRCGAVPALPYAERINGPWGMLSAIVFNQTASFACKPGYSKDGILGSTDTEFKVVCKADGTQTIGGTCVNVDDCASPENNCSPHGSCSDKTDPTGVHAEDFECICDSGFAQAIVNGTKSCENIPDCPPTACEPGFCTDLVNDYKCQCPAGYYEAANPKEKLAHDCLPVSCGKSPVLPRASTLQANLEIFFDKPTVQYTCDTGYTLDSTASGAVDFNLTCLKTKLFSAAPTCLPVSCGVPPTVINANFADNPFVFPQEASYSCHIGYSVSGYAGGPTKFRAPCEANGSFSGVLSCLPVACPGKCKKLDNFPPVCDNNTFGPHATFDSKSATSLVFGQSFLVTCLPGYALQKDDRKLVDYQISCLNDGKLSSPTDTCVPIDCGKPPVVPHSTVSGSTLFGEYLTATADEGFSLDGSASGVKTFTFHCTETGLFSKIGLFIRITCGEPASVQHTTFELYQKIQEQLGEPKLSLSQNRPNGRGLAVHRALLQKQEQTAEYSYSKNAKSAFYEDLVTYTCATGYRAATRNGAPVPLSDPKSFSMVCGSNGDMSVSSPSNMTFIGCLPVTCSVLAPTPEAVNIPEALEGLPFPILRSFGESQSFICKDGYSLDGTPTGEISFKEDCQADGKLSSKTSCKDIDWCILSQCGDHGRCVDGNLSYTCDCDPGYKRSMGELYETCVQIEECVTLGGHDNCAGNNGLAGTCEDATLAYHCKCNTGYEMTKPEGLEFCTPVVCPAAPVLKHAQSLKQGKKMSYLQTAMYTCNIGHTLSGIVNTAKDFVVTCQSDRTLTSFADCKPIKCESLPMVVSAMPDVMELVYNQTAKYTCSTGYTTTGHASAPADFSILCTETGKLTAASQCLPVQCGMPPKVQHATGDLFEMTFSMETTFTCVEGYTLTGQAGAQASFPVSCQADGLLTKMQTCLPVSCGVPPLVKHAQMPIQEMFYPDQFEVVCEGGYTIDHLPASSSSFSVSCGKKGAFIGMESCKPVTCGIPKSTTNSTSSDPEMFLSDVATWTCKPGFSVDGLPNGDDTYAKKCDKDGDFASSSPSKCIDIDFCYGNPCTANGFCTDSGVGVVNFGYTCQCNDGYEVRQRANGAPTCAADDCTGDPCGKGGVCTDLSKRGAPQGVYMCECEAGYELVEPEPKKPTCKRIQCGVLPSNIMHTVQTSAGVPQVSVITWLGKPAIIDAFYGMPLLRSFDKATYTCIDGYSTDGNTGPESKKFTVSCLQTGVMSKLLSPNDECQPVRCDNLDLPTVPNTKLVNPKGNDFVYGESAHFRCNTGYTIGGTITGSNNFFIPCRKDGSFPSEHASCSPVSCSVPLHDNALGPMVDTVQYSDVVIYNCVSGTSVGGSATGSMMYTGECKETGVISFDGVERCQSISCGVVEAQPNADMYISEGMLQEPTTQMLQTPLMGSETLSLTLAQTNKTGSSSRKLLLSRVGEDAPPLLTLFGTRQRVSMTPVLTPTTLNTWSPTVIVVCKTGFTVGGLATGASTYTLQCDRSGKIKISTSQRCSKTLYPVKGEVTDAQSAAKKLSGTEILVTQGTQVLGRTTASAWGTFEFNLAAGDYNFTGTLAGYIDRVKLVSVQSAVAVGQGADLALSKKLPPGSWRVTLNWGALSEDLDSHTYFGADTKHTDWTSLQNTDPFTGVEVDLDRDDVTGFGPETTSFKHTQNCKDKSRCLIKFKVNNYEPTTGDLGKSDGIVTLYKGNHVEKTWKIPESTGSALWYNVFTLDASAGQGTIHDGAFTLPPSLQETYPGITTAWANSMNLQGWSRVPEGAVLTGMTAHSLTNLHKIESASYKIISGSQSMQCEMSAWTTIPSSGWVTCNAGRFVNGFYRFGNRWDSKKTADQLKYAWCCKATELPARWGTCQDVPFFRSPGLSSCGKTASGVAMGLVGYRYVDSEKSRGGLATFYQGKCCTFADQ